ncbi:MAG: M48 family metalloprotease [Rubricoccaceae bacterium]|nr:M48 family metalloprotease [Rubricoccaceae bacterium]
MPVRSGRSGGRLVVGLIVAVIAVVSYFASTTVEENPVTGEAQRVSMNVDQEIALGLQAQPQMAAQHGGEYPSPEDQQALEALGERIVRASEAGTTPYAGHFDFHLLADPQTINAFALPGGQVSVTAGLVEALQPTEGELAGILAHEIAHVVGRHSAEQMAKAQLTQGLASAAAIAAYDPNQPGSAAQSQIAMLIGQALTTRYSREDELEADALGVQFMADAGYDPRAMASVMQKLGQAAGGARGPEFLSTHPNPDNRVARIEEAIADRFPDGVPAGLTR